MRSGHFQETYGQAVALSDNRTVWLWTAILALVLLAFPMAFSNYVVSFAVKIIIAAVGVIGLNMLTGTTGLISLGYSGFLAVGAYTNAILLVDYKWPLILTIPMAGLVSAAVSLLVGVPSLRLKGLYLAITTMAFAFIVNHFILYAEDLTHGPNGVMVPKVEFFGWPISGDVNLYYFSLGVGALMTFGALNILRTRIGRAWMAIRDHDIAANVMGVNLVRYKLLAFVVSSFYIGVAGALLSLQIRFINIDVFGLLLSIEALAMIILGGLGSVPGAIFGAAFLILLPEAIRSIFALAGGESSALFSKYVYEIRGVAYGFVIVLMLRYEPHGLMGKWRDIKRYWVNWPLSY
ncbi:MAG: branched-chain amino acid ABC transporter permease [Alphaproteobacteria bacterium]